MKLGRPCLFAIRPGRCFRSLQGRPRGFIKVARDETDRRQAEQALRASEEAAQADAQRVQLALAAGAIIGSWVWDLPTDRFTVDESFARAFGLDPAMGREGLSLEANGALSTRRMGRR